MAHDLIIRNGTVVDGTGAPARRADVAVDGGRVVAIEHLDGVAAKRVIDADGRVVTPGFVDLHSHFDAQIGWDPLLSSSCWHGVTTVLMGNCGMSFAPLRRGDHEVLARMMESVEDIPGDSIIDGLAWNWETYGDYLDAIESLPKGINVGGMVGHVAMRYYVMGERSIEDVAMTDSELAAFEALAAGALADGALGISTSRSLVHRVPDGRHVPGTWADARELGALGRALKAHPGAIFEGAPRFTHADGTTPRIEEETAMFVDIARHSGAPTTFQPFDAQERSGPLAIGIARRGRSERKRRERSPANNAPRDRRVVFARGKYAVGSRARVAGAAKPVAERSARRVARAATSSATHR